MSDPIQPAHYRNHPSGVEAIEITEHFNFCLGNAIKYIWRAGLKGEALEDLRKAQYYIAREITRLEKENYDAAAREDALYHLGPRLSSPPHVATFRTGPAQYPIGSPIGGPQDSEALPDAARDGDSGAGVSKPVLGPFAW
jgi:hypothetical protein